MRVDQSILSQLSSEAAEALSSAGSCWDTFVGDLTPGVQVIAIAATRAGASVAPSPEAQARWRQLKEVLYRFATEAHEDETVDMYRKLPARERHIVDDLVRALHGRR